MRHVDFWMAWLEFEHFIGFLVDSNFQVIPGKSSNFMQLSISICFIEQIPFVHSLFFALVRCNERIAIKQT